jgi:hypothetical protein
MHTETQSTDTNREPYQKFLRSVSGVILLASPSLGSALANISAPILKAVSAISGGMSAVVHHEHHSALKPSSSELVQITHDFDEFCKWYEAQHDRKLKVEALREREKIKGTAMVRLHNYSYTFVHISGCHEKVVDLTSADVPDSTRALVDFEVRQLDGLNHVEVTHFKSMEDTQLHKILEQICECRINQEDSRMAQPNCQRPPLGF